MNEYQSNKKEKTQVLIDKVKKSDWKIFLTRFITFYLITQHSTVGKKFCPKCIERRIETCVNWNYKIWLYRF